MAAIHELGWTQPERRSFCSAFFAEIFSSGNGYFFMGLIIFSCVCGINSHNFITGLIVIAVIELTYYGLIKRSNPAAIFIACSLAGLLAGASVVFFAPGNQVRLSAISYQGFSLHFLYFY